MLNEIGELRGNWRISRRDDRYFVSEPCQCHVEGIDPELVGCFTMVTVQETL